MKTRHMFLPLNAPLKWARDTDESRQEKSGSLARETGSVEGRESRE